MDEHLDAPPAIFTVRARETGRLSLQFSVWQDGREIAAVALPVQVIGSHEQPKQSVSTVSLTVPVQDAAIELQAAEGTALISKQKLVVEAGPQVGSEFPLSRDVISVGRSSANDLVLDDPSLSRHHAQLLRHAQGWMIADLGSTNGTFVNGVRVTGAQLVQPGDRIRLGECTLLLAEGELAAPTSAMAVGPQFLEEPSPEPSPAVAPPPPEEAAGPAALRPVAPAAAARPATPQAIAPPAVVPSQAAGWPDARAPSQRKGRSAAGSRAMTALALSAVYVVGLLGASSVSMMMLTAGETRPTDSLVTAIAGATPVSAATPVLTPPALPPPSDFEALTIASPTTVFCLAPLLWTLLFLLLVVVVMLVRRRRQRRKA